MPTRDLSLEQVPSLQALAQRSTCGELQYIEELRCLERDRPGGVARDWELLG